MPSEAPDVVSPALHDSRFRCNLKFAVLVLTLLPLLMSLGFWQLARATTKEQALAAFDLQRSAPPLPLAAVDLSDASPLTGRRVELRGHYLPANAFFLDNRVFRGHVGYELLMPFADASGRIALVNRGWLQAPPTRDKLPPIATPDEALVLQGRLYFPGTAKRPALYATAGWPSVVQAIDVEALAAQGLAALALTPSHAWVAPAGGGRPVFGTNPIAFAWPRPTGRHRGGLAAREHEPGPPSGLRRTVVSSGCRAARGVRGRWH